MAMRINYSKVVSQAKDIAGNANELIAQIRMLEKMEQECRQHWKGEAANIFLAKLSALRNEMYRTRSQMSELSSTIKKCADKIQREDNEKAKKATSLSSGF